MDQRGGTDERPVQIVDGAVVGKRVDPLLGLRPPFVLEFGRVEEPHARRDLETRRTADHQESPNACAAQALGQPVRDVDKGRGAVAPRDSADHGVRAEDGLGDRSRVGRVDAARPAHAGHVVAALLELGDDSAADHAVGAEDDDLHCILLSSIGYLPLIEHIVPLDDAELVLTRRPRHVPAMRSRW